MLLFADGFDGEYSVTADLTKVWDSNSNTSNITYQATGGRWGGGCVQTITSGGLFSPVPPNVASLTSQVMNMAFWFIRTAKPAAAVFPWAMTQVNAAGGANGTGF